MHPVLEMFAERGRAFQHPAELSVALCTEASVPWNEAQSVAAREFEAYRTAAADASAARHRIHKEK